MPYALSVHHYRWRKKKAEKYIISAQLARKLAAKGNNSVATTIQDVTKPLQESTASILTTKQAADAPKKENIPPKASSNHTAETRSGVSGLSLKSLAKKKEILALKKEQVLDLSNLPKKQFSYDEMISAWNLYIEQLTAKGEKILASNLQTDTPTLNNTTIGVEFPNDTMRVELERAQGPLLEHLKRTLQNYDITLKITVNEVTKRRYAYTTPEKYNRLKELNTHIETLKNRFDLEL